LTRQAFPRALRDRLPLVAHLHRGYMSWAYSHRRAARIKLFQAFARENRWGDPDTVSGTGSNLEQTLAIREELPRWWDEFGIRRLADVPCGDFFWMSSIVGNLDYYFGGDIVFDVVWRARERAPAHCKFAVFDLLTDDFPDVDAVLVRDALVCLSNRDVARALRNIARSSARYLLTTTFPNEPQRDITTGEWRPLDLNAPPFSLPKPIRIMDERCSVPGFAGKRLGVWEVSELRGARG
jgi:hypothetical protein